MDAVYFITEKKRVSPVKCLGITQCNVILLLFLLLAAHRCLILSAEGHREVLKAGTLRHGAAIDKVMTMFK